ncbi:uncharacterized protein PV09_06038 [Verruconis gallopava]|uniref:Uncharacterized protein n=1 Tax=Verruconis gallopava TaxID=253628 RepID=A0A0D2A780_9PEZI|nr:uncharacterized protein PV09_06038 [Verruconis gallopava]KIW02588.1 hypothetical protein PV09_06038 [Verruconis gallopava]
MPTIHRLRCPLWICKASFTALASSVSDILVAIIKLDITKWNECAAVDQEATRVFVLASSGLQEVSRRTGVPVQERTQQQLLSPSPESSALTSDDNLNSLFDSSAGEDEPDNEQPKTSTRVFGLKTDVFDMSDPAGQHLKAAHGEAFRVKTYQMNDQDSLEAANMHSQKRKTRSSSLNIPVQPSTMAQNDLSTNVSHAKPTCTSSRKSPGSKFMAEARAAARLESQQKKRDEASIRERRRYTRP